MEKKVINNRYSYGNVEIQEEYPMTSDVPETMWISLKSKKRRMTVKEITYIYDKLFDEMYWTYIKENGLHHFNYKDDYGKFCLDVGLPFIWWICKTVGNRNTPAAVFESHGVTVMAKKFNSRAKMIKIIICRKGELRIHGDFHSKS